MNRNSATTSNSRRVRISYAIAFALASLILGALSCSLRGPEPTTPAPPLPARSLRVGTSGDYPPFSHWPADAAEPAGFSVDVAKAYAGARGRRVEWIRFGWPHLHEDLEGGRFDLALSGVTVRPDRSVAGRFSLPLSTSGAVVLVASDSELYGARDLEAPGLTIAVNAGGHLERVTRRLFPEADVRAVRANERVLERLGEEGVRAIVTDTLEAPIWQARRPGLRAIGPLTRDRKAAWLRTDLPDEEIRGFDDWLLRAEASGELRRLRARHGLPAVATAEPSAALLASLDERLSLMIDVARAKGVLALAIEDRPREARVLEAAIQQVAQAATSMDVRPPDSASIRRFYAAQIEAAKWIQRGWLEAHPSLQPADEGAARREARADLDDRLRPALLFLGDRIARLVIAAIDAGRRPPPTLEQVEAALARHGLPDERLSAIHAALAELLRTPIASAPGSGIRDPGSGSPRLSCTGLV